MAQHNCPNCKKYGFTWHRNDDDTSTIWTCRQCPYSACEDESYEHACPCENGGSVCRLDDGEKTYWWCSRCDQAFLIPEVEEHNGFKRYSTEHPTYLFAALDEIKKRGEVYVHTRYWAAGGHTDDEIFRDMESFKKNAAAKPPSANMMLILGHRFLLVGVVDEAFIEKALHFPYAKPEILLVVEEKDISKNRAFYAPWTSRDNMVELKEDLEDLKGQNVRIGYPYWVEQDNKEEVLGYVPYPSGVIDWQGPY